MIDGQSCETCTHFYSGLKSKAEGSLGQCRYGPPQLIALHGEIDRATFPLILASDPGCGRYKRVFRGVL